MNNELANALKNNNLKALSLIPKVDFHLHASRSCRLNDFADAFGVDKISCPDKFQGFNDMERWVSNNIHRYVNSTEDWEKRISLMFLTQKKDMVNYYEPSFTIKDVKRYHSVTTFIETMKMLHRRIFPESHFAPCLSLSRKIDPRVIYKDVQECLETGWFRSIDLCNDETIGTIEDFVNIYKLANRHSIMRKAHVGEYGDFRNVINAISKLDLNEIQHGITIVNDREAIKYAVRRDVLFNVCPASNIALGLCRNYSEHPIKKMFHEGLKITISTDDILVFNKSLSEQIMLLYRNSIFSSKELSQILHNGFKRREMDWKK